MLTKSEILITKRFLFSKKTEGYVSIFSWFSIIGISLGVAAIIIVMSVMNGFRSNLTERLIGVNSHVNIYPLNEIIKSIDIDLLKKEKLYDKIWQAFCVLLPVKTVGVMGDSRTYEYVCAIRAVTSIDGMTADYYPFDQNFLKKVSSNIINKVKGINRVVYDTTSKPPGTIEWE